MISLPTNKIAICLIQANHKSFDTNYQAADSESVQAEYDELMDIPQTAISLTATIRLQSTTSDEGARTDSNRCNCKANCSTRRCSCKRANST